MNDYLELNKQSILHLQDEDEDLECFGLEKLVEKWKTGFKDNDIC